MYQPWHQLSQFAAHHPLSSANKNVSRQLDTITQPARSDLFQFNGKYTVNTHKSEATQSHRRALVPQFIIGPLHGEQLAVAPALGDLTLLQDKDPVRFHDRGESESRGNILQFI